MGNKIKTVVKDTFDKRTGYTVLGGVAGAIVVLLFSTMLADAPNVMGGTK